MSRLKKINEKRQTGRVIYERTKEDREPSRHPRLIYIILAVFVAALAYLVLFSGALNIRQINVEGFSKPEELAQVAEAFQSEQFLGDNILFINTEKLGEKIGENSRIRSVDIRRSYPNDLNIIIEESNGAIVWNTAGESFVIDGRGYVIENNYNEDLPAVKDNTNIPTGLGERVASPTFIKYIIDLSTDFGMITGEEIDEIIILDILSDIHVKSKSGWTVYLDSTKDPKSQLENLNKVLRAAAESGHSRLQYIDMRLQDKVFYK